MVNYTSLPFSLPQHPQIHIKSLIHISCEQIFHRGEVVFYMILIECAVICDTVFEFDIDRRTPCFHQLEIDQKPSRLSGTISTLSEQYTRCHFVREALAGRSVYAPAASHSMAFKGTHLTSPLPRGCRRSCLFARLSVCRSFPEAPERARLFRPGGFLPQAR